MRTCIVLGTRPEIVKMAPIVRELQRRKMEFIIIHTGQHYSHQMDQVFFEELELPAADHNLGVGSGSHGKQTGVMLEGLEDIFDREKPDMVLVQGDTNTVLAGALAASKMLIPIGHVEAGLRSFDRNMPEEVNRVLADHLSDLLFAPTEVSRGNLLQEGIAEEKIHVTGNTVVDAVRENLEIARRRSRIIKELDLEQGSYLLATLHRAENVDSPTRLKSLVAGLSAIAMRLEQEVVLPLHPRTRKNLLASSLTLPPEVRIMEPVGYLDFLLLESHANLILTDSGGVQEEACILKIPCVTLRDNTERPETVQVGANRLAGADPETIVKRSEEMLSMPRTWSCPLGDGNSAERIVDLVR